MTHLAFEKDTDAYARDRDAEVMKLATELNVNVIVKTGEPSTTRIDWWKQTGAANYEHFASLKGPGASRKHFIHLIGPGRRILGQIPRPIQAPDSLPDTPPGFEHE